MRLIALNSSESVTAVVRDRRRNQFSGSISILCNKASCIIETALSRDDKLGLLGACELDHDSEQLSTLQTHD